MPQVRHREQMGLDLEHLTLARKQPSQDARIRGWRGLVELGMATKRDVTKRKKGKEAFLCKG